MEYKFTYSHPGKTMRAKCIVKATTVELYEAELRLAMNALRREADKIRRRNEN